MEDRILTKLVITNRKALLLKYQRSGYRAIKAALKEMMAADLRRGIVLKLAFLDAPVAGYAAVSDPMSQWQCKRAVDELYKKFERPDYVLLLGGADVVPFQELSNPCADYGDLDFAIPSDLPYACDYGYGTRVDEFCTPTRVVGRLPDLPGATDASTLVQLIHHACGAPPLANQKCFALSSRSRKSVTEEALRLSFSDSPPVVWSTPPYGPELGRSWLGRSFHFIDCYGRPDQVAFLATPDDGRAGMQIAMSPASVTGHLRGPAIVAATASFGAQIHAIHSHPSTAGMGMAYLMEGAPAYLGSSSRTYGGASATDVACADVICTDFLALVAGGASSGRSFLEARQRFIGRSEMLDPFQLKTLAQFVLYGDPSYRGQFLSGAAELSPGDLGDHHRRRRQLTAIGKSLEHQVYVPVSDRNELEADSRSSGRAKAEQLSEHGLSVVWRAATTASRRPHMPRRRHLTSTQPRPMKRRLRDTSGRGVESAGPESLRTGRTVEPPDLITPPISPEMLVAIASTMRSSGELTAVVTRLIAGKPVSQLTVVSR